MVLPIALAVLVLAVVVVIWRGRRHTETIESRIGAEGHIGVVTGKGADAGAECPTCGEVFETPEDLEHHVAQYHPAA